MCGRKQWNKQAATSFFLDKKPPKSLEQQGLEGSTAVGKDEVGSSNLPSSSRNDRKSKDFRSFSMHILDWIFCYIRVFSPLFQQICNFSETTFYQVRNKFETTF